MLGRTKYVVSILGATALAGSLLTEAFASHPAVWNNVVSAARVTNFGNKVVIHNVLQVRKNESVYGHFYAHNALQVWSGATVRTGGLRILNGGIKTDSLESTGPISATGATISGNLSANNLSTTGALSGGNLAVSGAATIGGTLAVTGATTIGGILTASGKVAGNGLDAGTGAITGGSLTTSGDVNAANVTAHGNLSTTGTFAALSGQFQNLTATGSVNFTNANVTGLNIGGLSSLSLGSPSATTTPLNLSENSHTIGLGVDNTGALSVPSLAAGVGSFQALVLGASTSTISPLTLTENGKSAQLGVDANGNLTASNLLVSGTATLNNLTLTGTNSGLITSTVTAPFVSNTANPGPLTLTGNGISLVGATTVNGGLTLGNDLTLDFNPTATTNNPVFATHINANGDTDVAGTLSMVIPTGTTPAVPATATLNFTRAYASPPIVVVTPTTDASAGSGQQPSIWVTTTASSFTIHLSPSTATTSVFGVSFNYHVIGH